MYILDTKSLEFYFVVRKEDGSVLCWISKRANTLESIMAVHGSDFKEVI